MSSLLFLSLVAIIALVAAVRETKKTRQILLQHSKKLSVVPKVVSTMILVAQASELLKMLDHISVVNVVGSLLLLAIMAAAKPGTGGEWER